MSSSLEDLVVTLHDFVAVPPTSDSCLSFKSGQVIRVLNRDQSGWWDGEIVSASVENSSISSSSPIRGWFPSSYVSSVNVMPKSIIMSSRRPSIVSTISELSISDDCSLSSPSVSTIPTPRETSSSTRSNSGHSVNSYRKSFGQEFGFSAASNLMIRTITHLQTEVYHHRLSHIQPATAKIISAVRSILDSTQCLNRDSTILSLHSSLSYERKQILVVLAALVAKARKITRQEESNEADCSNTTLVIGLGLSESQNHTQGILKLADKLLLHAQKFLSIAQEQGVLISKSNSQLYAFTRQSSNLSVTNLSNQIDLDLNIGSSKSSTQSVFHQRTKSTKSINSNPSTPLNIDLPCSNSYSSSQMANLIERSHDQVLSTVAVFIGHSHLHTRSAHPSSHAYLIDMTHDVIDNVGEILVLVECIYKAKSNHSKQQPSMDFLLLTQARESLYLATTNLVTAARVATSGPLQPTTPIEDESDSLLGSATAVLRAANECMVAMSRCLNSSHSTYEEYEVPLSHSIFNMSFLDSLPIELPSESSDLIPINSNQQESFKRSRHTLSMLCRKAHSLNMARSQFELALDSVKSSQPLQNEIKPSFRLSSSSKSESKSLDGLETPNAGNSHQNRFSEIQSENDEPTEEMVTAIYSKSSITSQNFSGIPYSEKRISISRSRSSSSDSHHSHDSSPPTSASLFQVESGFSHQADRQSGQSDYFKQFATTQKLKPQNASHDPNLPQTQNLLAEELTFNSSGQVIGGTLKGLITQLTLHDTPAEASFSHTFFMTFRMFTTPTELAHALIARFALTCISLESGNPKGPILKDSSKTPIRLRVYNVIKSWLELHWISESDTIVLPVILHWAQTQMSTVLPGPTERLVNLVQKRIKESQTPAQRLRLETRLSSRKGSFNESISNLGKIPTPPPILTKQLMVLLSGAISSLNSLQLIEFEPIELARQITLMESKLYRAIKPEEILGKPLNKKQGLAVNVRAMSATSTKMTGWITETILNEDDIRKRSQILKFWIKTGTKLLELQNYNALMSVMSALNSSTLTRLKRTWENVGNKTKAIFDSLNKAVCHQRNYAEYRATLRTANTPCIPFLGVYLTDMTFCHEGNPTHRVSPRHPDLKLINFDRYRKMTKIISEIERFQAPYNLVEVPEIIKFIKLSINSLSHEGSADSLYQRSLRLEPRES
ncbi:hypothetical protein O181_043952 [Austropuccinia psidii MF-1]|uniref:Ras GEF n=1 Tax=Austropuccinia psidii MF-1 TaxID=1389203 RepID=A0A9Q3HHB4_9BASI|nr:hypothetical protein [Austropuccinia psidii MF-1]